jgi:hypothetical protein
MDGLPDGLGWLEKKDKSKSKGKWLWLRDGGGREADFSAALLTMRL